MKRFFGLVSLLGLFAVASYATLHTYTNTSVLNTGHFVKIRVAETGICRLTYEQLQAAGLRPDQIRVYGYGGAMLDQDFTKPKLDDLPQVPTYMYKGDDGVFGAGDFILFYVKGPIDWTFTGTRFRHTINVYSNYGYYFLSDDAGEMMLLDALEEEETTKTAYDVTVFSDYRLHEQELINLIDKAGRNGSGREWYGERLDAGQSLTLDFNFPNLVPTNLLYCTVDYATVSHSTTDMQVTIGKDTKKYTTSSIENNFITHVTGALNSRYTPTADDQQTVTLHYVGSASSDYAYLNYIEIAAVRRLQLTEDKLLRVSNTQHYGETRPSRYHVQEPTANTLVWNVTTPDSIFAVPTWRNDEGELLFYAPNEDMQFLYVLDPTTTATVTPEIIGTVPNQNLHALQNIDFVILTHEMFLAEANQLADAHEQYDGMTTAVVTDQEVYNEFSSGTPDATAYRWLMKMLYDRAKRDSNIQAPQNLLLIGDGSFDNRNILTTSATPILLTYQSRTSNHEVNSVATDDYFTFLRDTAYGEDYKMIREIGIGRFPVQTVDQAQAMVNKTVKYIANRTTGAWKNQLCFLADDGDNNLHTAAANTAAELIRKRNPEFVVNKIYLDAYQQEKSASGESYPQARTKLLNLLRSGVMYFDFCGHASYNNITSERVLTAADGRDMINENLGFWVLATCNFARFDARTTSAAEEAVLNPNGGALALLSSCRTVYASQNQVLNDSVAYCLFQQDADGNYTTRIGEAVRKAKNKYTVKKGDANSLPYILMGDPAVLLHFPTDYRVETTTEIDTLRALGVCHATGEIRNRDTGERIDDFNGTVRITVYDKLQSITTMDNDNTVEANKTRFTYLDYPNIIYKGAADVLNGRFSYDFMVPKDIRYNMGDGRIVYYATDTLTNEEAVGYDHNLTVGGSSPITYADTIGPDIWVYLNNQAFQNGGTVNATPHFFARLEDEHGINTTGSGIGHDLKLVIDDDPKQTYYLNDYFTADMGSFQEGLVSFMMDEVETGRHTLTFRAWDLLNNSSTATVDFVVSDKDEPTIITVITYPNPTEDDVYMFIDHDRPDDVIFTTLYVYDISGRKVLEQQWQGNNIEFNPNSAGLAAGIYVYQIKVKTTTSAYATKAGKFLIK